jgi:MFS family permease
VVVPPRSVNARNASSSFASGFTRAETRTSFIVSFGVTKAIINLIAARASDRIGRKPILVVGWLFALPVPFLIIYAPSWWWIDLANVLLGANQAMAWSIALQRCRGPRRYRGSHPPRRGTHVRLWSRRRAVDGPG